MIKITIVLIQLMFTEICKNLQISLSNLSLYFIHKNEHIN